MRLSFDVVNMDTCRNELLLRRSENMDEKYYRRIMIY